MGKVHDEIGSELRAFIEAQRMFFVATSALDPQGHVNVSPKGLDCFRILSPTSVAYLDYVGSGAETIAHVRQNRRITLMFCAFDGPPKILRLYGYGTIVDPDDPDFTRLRPRFPPEPAARAIVVVKIARVADSCGFGVPIYTFERQRAQLVDWASRKGSDGLIEYQREKNATSIDGLPAATWLTKAPSDNEA